MNPRNTALLAALAAFTIGGTAVARDQILIVGSSTVFPFSTAVAESYARASGAATPVVESTGSGGGMKLFCSGIGTDTPDVTNASRRMKAKEFKLCNENGVTDIIESIVGFDGIVVANATAAPTFELSREILFKALAKGQGEPTMWNEIDPSLPAAKIEVLGPPPSSGTRDAFEELAIQEGCKEAGNEKAFCKAVEIRDDGVYVDAGENDLSVTITLTNAAAGTISGGGFTDLGGGTDYSVSFSWMEDFEALHIACGFDMRVPKKRHVEAMRLLSQINEQLLFGHFEIWPQDGSVLFRQAMPLSGGADVNAGVRCRAAVQWFGR